jgi:hypothetical protein
MGWLVVDEVKTGGIFLSCLLGGIWFAGYFQLKQVGLKLQFVLFCWGGAAPEKASAMGTLSDEESLL